MASKNGAQEERPQDDSMPPSATGTPKAGAPASDSSLLMDMLPPELRLKIFGLALQAETARIWLPVRSGFSDFESQR